MKGAQVLSLGQLLFEGQKEIEQMKINLNNYNIFYSLVSR